MDIPPDQHVPCVLTIGGMDPSGGAGLTADARAIAAFGAHCCPITTAVIAQNTCGMAGVEAVSGAMLGMQLDNLLEDITPQAVKIGMVPSAEAISIIVTRLRQLPHIPIVVDPVLAPSTGAAFAGADTIKALINELLPLTELVTPNLPEAAQLSHRTITDRASLVAAATAIQSRSGARYVLIKGGHPPPRGPGDGPPSAAEAVDILCDGREVTEFATPWQTGYEVRGTGCALASAIAAQRARGIALPQAVREAKRWLTGQIHDAKVIGRGRRVATL